MPPPTPERATIGLECRVGAEAAATPGTLVSAAKRLRATRIIPRPMPTIAAKMGVGVKVAVAHVAGYEHTQARVEGFAAYNDLTYVFGAHCQQGQTVNAFSIAPSALETPQTFTVDYGLPAAVARFGYGFIPDVQLRFTETEVNLTGQMLGQVMAKGLTGAASPTDILAVPIGPKDWSVSVGTALDGSDLVALTRCKEAEFASKNRWRPGYWAGGGASFPAVVETAPAITGQLIAENNSTAEGILTDLQTAAQKLISYHCVGGIVVAGGGIHYDLKIQFPFVYQDEDDTDQQGEWGATFNFNAQYAPTFASNKLCTITLVNDIAAY